MGQLLSLSRPYFLRDFSLRLKANVFPGLVKLGLHDVLIPFSVTLVFEVDWDSINSTFLANHHTWVTSVLRQRKILLLRNTHKLVVPVSRLKEFFLYAYVQQQYPLYQTILILSYHFNIKWHSPSLEIYPNSYLVCYCLLQGSCCRTIMWQLVFVIAENHILSIYPPPGYWYPEDKKRHQYSVLFCPSGSSIHPIVWT